MTALLSYVGATRLLVAGTALVWVVWDLIAYGSAGGAATESTLVGGLLSRSVWAVTAMGLLCGHFLGSNAAGRLPWTHAAAFAGACLLGYLSTTLE